MRRSGSGILKTPPTPQKKRFETYSCFQYFWWLGRGSSQFNWLIIAQILPNTYTVWTGGRFQPWPQWFPLQDQTSQVCPTMLQSCFETYQSSLPILKFCLDKAYFSKNNISWLPLFSGSRQSIWHSKAQMSKQTALIPKSTFIVYCNKIKGIKWSLIFQHATK